MQNDQFIIKLLLDQWEVKVNQLTALFRQLGEDAAEKEIAPGRNTVGYLLGHLTVASDMMLEALELGSRMVPDYDQYFFVPHSKETEIPEFSSMLVNWIGVNEFLLDRMKSFEVNDWLQKHAYVKAGDFEREPHRNRLNILISRNAHLSNHYGQLLLAKEK